MKTWRWVGASVSGAALFGLVVASCSVDAGGTSEQDGPDGSVRGDSTEYVDGSLPDFSEIGSDCHPATGTACTSPGGCFSGTITCAGTCDAPADPAMYKASCTTGGCEGTIDCDGKCKLPPSGADCDPTANGCKGKLACDGTCVDTDAKIGAFCVTAKGCGSRVQCDLSCPDDPTWKVACTSATCAWTVTTDCSGKCPDPVWDTTLKCATCYSGTTAVDVKYDKCGCPTCASKGLTDKPDAGVDTGIDTGTDTGVDTGTDTGTDTGVDTGTDTGPDTTVPPDSSVTDAKSDAKVEASPVAD